MTKRFFFWIIAVFSFTYNFGCFQLWSQTPEKDEFLQQASKIEMLIEAKQSAEVSIETQTLLDLAEKEGYSNETNVEKLLDLGGQCEIIGQLITARHFYQESVKIAVKLASPRLIVKAKQKLALLLVQELDYDTAENELTEALALCETKIGEESLETAAVLIDLANLRNSRLYSDDYFLEIDNMLNDIIFSIKEKNDQFPEIDANEFFDKFYNSRDTLTIYKRALNIYQKNLPSDDYRIGNVLNNIGLCMARQKNFDSAFDYCRESIEIKNKNKDYASMLPTIFDVCLILIKQREYKKAYQILTQAIHIYENNHEENEIGIKLYTLRILNTDFLLAKQILPDETFKDLESLAERGLDDYQRSVTIFRRCLENFHGSEKMLANLYNIHARAIINHMSMVKGDPREVFLTLEQTRAFSMQRMCRLNEMTSAQSEEETPSLLKLREQLNKKEIDVCKLEKEIGSILERGMTDENDRKKYFETRENLKKTKEEMEDAGRAVLDTSPFYQKIRETREKPVLFNELKKDLETNRIIVLEYLTVSYGHNLGDKIHPSVILFAYGSGIEHPLFYELRISEETANELNEISKDYYAAKGFFSNLLMDRILSNHNKTGIFDRLESEQNTQDVTKTLSILWKLLIPDETLRKSILDEKTCEQLLVIPDGALCRLPFEMLTVGGDVNDPYYLLDKGPAVLYAPSASFYFRRKNRPSLPIKHLLTLADPNYQRFNEVNDTNEALLPSVLKYSMNDARVLAQLGMLNSLVFSGMESDWISDIGQNNNLEVTSLTDDEATEKNIREQIANKELIHFACHGYAENEWNNKFGALIMTPGDNTPLDDGFLSVMEIYNLNLTSTELAILSACQTNRGVEQYGEGCWSLGRAFLIAGAKRTVTSNWFVDDEATATLIYFFVRNLFEDQNEINYSQALKKAKQSLRKSQNNPKWKSPYYWAPFILMGTS